MKSIYHVFMLMISATLEQWINGTMDQHGILAQEFQKTITFYMNHTSKHAVQKISQ